MKQLSLETVAHIAAPPPGQRSLPCAERRRPPAEGCVAYMFDAQRGKFLTPLLALLLLFLLLASKGRPCNREPVHIRMLCFRRACSANDRRNSTIKRDSA
jgi:hypothetical protein